MGDTAQGTAAQKQIAVRIAAGDPDYVFIAGDIVYSRGRISEYREKFFPVFNRDEKDPAYGAPLLRSIPFVAAPGNHDLGRDFSIATDLLAYFLYWRQPLNGPAAAGPAPSGPPAAVGRFTAAAGGRFPRMANFSFDYGNVHWVALDSMPYMDWTSPVLREWLAADLKAVPASTWKLAGFHHPGFNSSRAHFNEQRMRVLAPLFEECGVDIVFNGHVHNYQRSFPLTFVPRRQPDGSFYLANGNVEGAWTLDRAFDGTPAKRPRGVLYIVTGGGGAGLYNPEQQSAPATWQPFTAKFVSSVHSLTLVEAGPQKLVLRQVSALGQELDSLVLTK
jgi:predicted phosphodiesterase